MGLIKGSATYAKPLVNEIPNNLYYNSRSYFSDDDTDYFTITNVTQVTPEWLQNPLGSSSLQFKLPNKQWENAVSGAPINVTDGVIQFRGKGRNGLFNNTNTAGWSLIGSNVILSGDINTLLDYTTPIAVIDDSAFQYLFSNCGNITDISGLKMPAITVGTYSYYAMFSGNLIQSLNGFQLPATTLSIGCYKEMFRSNYITSLEGFSLPATTVPDSAYAHMFQANQINTLRGFELPATSVGNNSYYCMFLGNDVGIYIDHNNIYPSEWTFRIPTNGSGVFHEHAMDNMFSARDSITTPTPGISYYYGEVDYFTIANATDIKVFYDTRSDDLSNPSLQYSIDNEETWNNIESGNTISEVKILVKFRGFLRKTLFTNMNPTNAWEISGDNVILQGDLHSLLDYRDSNYTLGDNAFAYMFGGGSDILHGKITNISYLNVRNIGDLGVSAFANMFQWNQIDSLGNFTLPFTTLSGYCYRSMFRGNNITSISGFRLPAPETEDSCYAYMFAYNQIDNFNDFYLPSQYFADNAYINMFEGNPIKIWEKPSQYVPVEHTFRLPYQGNVTGLDPYYYPTDMFAPIKDESVIAPEFEETYYWGIENPIDYFTVTGATMVYPKVTQSSSDTPNFQYTLDDGLTWINYGGYAIDNISGPIKFRGKGRNTLFSSYSTENAWQLTGTNIKLSGNINTLLDYENPPMTVGDNCFHNMFTGSSVVDITELKLPALTIGEGAYGYMFYNSQVSQIAGFELPATIIGDSCYTYMFRDSRITELVDFVLPASVIPPHAYNGMFEATSTLTRVDNFQILAHTVDDYGCISMFGQCAINSLVNFKLEPTSISESSYQGMFKDNQITSIAGFKFPAQELALFCYQEMFNNNLIENLDGINLNYNTGSQYSHYLMFANNKITTLNNCSLVCGSGPVYDSAFGSMFSNNLITNLIGFTFNVVDGLTGRHNWFCFESMFANNLIDTLENFTLPSALVPYFGYAYMFANNPIRLYSSPGSGHPIANAFRIPTTGYGEAEDTWGDQTITLGMFDGEITDPEVNITYYWGVS